MFALSVKQPHAEAIASGAKPYEYRSWMTRHRGDLLIVASKSPIVDGLPVGVAICVVTLAEIEGPELGTYEWRLENPRRVAPLALRGFAALYKVEDARLSFDAPESGARLIERAEPIAIVVVAPPLAEPALRDVAALATRYSAWRGER